mgnify:CR=1 FL=1
MSSALRRWLGDPSPRMVDVALTRPVSTLFLGLLGQETTGPGGIAYGLRTLPVVHRLAERLLEDDAAQSRERQRV